MFFSSNISEFKIFIESSPVPLVIYTFENGKISTFLVSEGFIALQNPEMTRDDVIHQLNYNMYVNVHSDDSIRIANAAREFALYDKTYDVIYREKLYGGDEYCYLHAYGYHQFINNKRYAIVTYDDISAAVSQNYADNRIFDHSILELINKTNEAMAVITIDTHEILMSNSTIRALLHPSRSFDSGITFEEYFFSADEKPWIDFDSIADKGESIIVNPENNSELVFRVRTSTFAGKDVYIISANLKDVKYHDSLTGLANMNYFLLRGVEKVNQILSENNLPTIIYFDLSNMKKYNYTYGFQAGNELLKNVANVLKEYFSDQMVCRFSDDHFVVVGNLPDYQTRIRAVHQMILNLGQGLTVEIKAGIYQISRTETDLTLACDYARLACKSIKNTMDKYYQVYNPILKATSDLYEYVSVNIDKAIKNEEIIVYYQPVIRTSTNQVCGFEALSRWKDSVYGLLSPGVFIAALEETHQIHKLDSYIIKKICQDLRYNLDHGNQVVPVSFNLSKLDFISCDIYSIVEEQVELNNIPRKLINIEITESIMISDKFIRDIIEKFHKTGYSVWMDDFGSGYSSLNVLKDYNFDELKIDMDFISSFTDKSKHIIQSTVEMASRIGIETLAEGVETDEQYSFLKEIGCEKVQGFLFGKPLPITECMKNCETLGLKFEEII